MDHPRLTRPAPVFAALIIAGLLGGIVLGSFRAWFDSAEELRSLLMVIKSGVVGFFLGVVAVLIVVLVDRRTMATTRGLTALAVIAAVVLWFFLRVLGTALG